MSEATHDDINRIHDRLDEINNKLGEVAEHQAAILTRCGTCQTTLTRHDAALFGNGRQGLVEQVAVLKARKPTLGGKALAYTIGAAIAAGAAAAKGIAAVWK